MKDVLFFDKMITPKVITFIYWLLLLVVVVMGLVTMFSVNFLMGLLYLLGGIIGARIYCELLIVLFKMNDALQELKDK